MLRSWDSIAIPSGATFTLLAFPKSCGQANAANEGPYKPYLHERWAKGVRNIKRLVAELRERGYRHGETIVYDYLRSMREQPVWPGASPVSRKKQTYASSQSALSAREAAWLFVRNPQRLGLAQVVKLDHVRRSDEEWESAYQLAQDFRVMVTRRQHNVLDRWLTEAREQRHC